MRKLLGAALVSALSAVLLLGTHASSAAIDVAVSVNIAPPELPVYEQPDIPGPGYIWTPGYWAWADDGSGYYWVPGTWVLAPEPGYLWTPGWWGWENDVYLWHPGYWGTDIGFYGGVNYGFGYFGHGFDGGYWDHGTFRYNSAYTRIGSDVHITNVYNKTVVNNVTVNHVSFNGGSGGIQLRPTPQEVSAEHAHHLQPVAAQLQQRDAARSNPALRLSANHGHPAIAATARPAEFSGRGVIAAHGAPAVHETPPATTQRPLGAALPPRAPVAPAVRERTPPPPEPRLQNAPPRPPTPEVQRTPEVPRNVEPQRNVEPPRPPQPQPREQPKTQPKPEQQREPERREEPH
jgi:hypothetical protein